MAARKKILLITISQATRQGIYFYLESIFRSYLQLDSVHPAQIDHSFPFDEYEMILCPSAHTYGIVKNLIPENKKTLITTRIINPVNLHKIIHIPPSSTVYLVNDNKNSANDVIGYLKEMGFTQYHYIPIYPGCENYIPSINYAITVGEPELVPPGISTIINIGNRIVDISTINEIVTYFSLPASLLNEITKNYIINLVRVLKLANGQLYSSFQMQRIYNAIGNNLSTGFCIYDDHEKQIRQFNSAFVRLLGFSKTNLLDASIESLLLESGLSTAILTDPAIDTVNIAGTSGEKLLLTKKLIQQNDSELLYMLTAEPLHPPHSYPMNDFSLPQTASPQHFNFDDYFTQDTRCKNMLASAEKIALTDYNLIIQGESGTGKEVLARAIHHASSRSQKPFVRLISISLSKDNSETELLGLENVALSDGSSGTQPGILDLANGGTLFIDGIEHMSLHQQSILLAAITEKRFRRIGGRKAIPLDVRIIAAAKQDLFQAVLNDTFMNELYFTINVMSLYTIPLRNRVDDIPLILEYYLRNTLGTSGFHLSDMASEEFMTFIRNYSWPGNTTEVINLSRYLISSWNSQRFSITDLPEYMLRNSTIGRELLLSELDLQLLRKISDTPKIGRSRLLALVETDFPSLTDGKIRTTLNALAEKQLIRVNRTRGGCEITEYGKLALAKGR